MTWMLMLCVLGQAGRLAPSGLAPSAPGSSFGDSRFKGGRPAPVAAAPWWQAANDAHLQALVAEALACGYDVRIAREKIAQSRAQAAAALAPVLPSVSLDGAGSVSRGGTRLSGGGASGGGFFQSSTPIYIGSAALNASLNVDVWGKNYLAYAAAQKNYEAQGDTQDAVGVALSYTVASTYHDAVAAKEQLALAEEQLALNSDLAEVVSLRFASSEATALDVLQQRQLVAASRARIPAVRVWLQVALNQLGALLNRPGAVDVAEIGERLTLPPQPNTGKPVDLLGHRPDLRAAWALWLASSDASKSAFRAHLPTVGLNGSWGYQALVLTSTITQPTWSAGVTVSLPLFAGGGLSAAVAQAEARERAASLAYAQAVRNAVADVEQALAQEHELGLQLEAVQEQLDAASQAFGESKTRYLAGLTTYLNVTTALTAKQQTEQSAVQARRALLGARVGLLTALGGPWTRRLSRQAQQEASDEVR